MQSRKNGQKHIWLLSGTGEGPLLAIDLIEKGWKVTVSVVSASASWPYLELSLTSLLIGPLQGVQGIKEVLGRAKDLHSGFDWVIDATHPFAVEISSNLQEACYEFGQSLIRFERPLEKPPGTYLIEDWKELSTHSFQGRNVLMALGARHLREAVFVVHQAGAKVFARVLPNPESLKQALKSQVAECDIAVLRPLQGNSIGEFEKALCRRWSISDVVSRQSGGATQQLWQEICKDENIDLWLIARPELVGGVEIFHTINSLMDHISIG